MAKKELSKEEKEKLLKTKYNDFEKSCKEEESIYNEIKEIKEIFNLTLYAIIKYKRLERLKEKANIASKKSQAIYREILNLTEVEEEIAQEEKKRIEEK